MSDTYEQIKKLAEEYDYDQLLEMFDDSLEEGKYYDKSFMYGFAVMINRINVFNKQIEEIKQCLSTKKDSEKPIGFGDYYPDINKRGLDE